MKKLLLLSVCFGTILMANTINIAVAANVSYAINDLINAFNQKHPHTKVNVTLGSSGKLTAQIKNGAPYDLFMSANMYYPNSLYENQFALEKPAIYAQGSLALLSSKPQDFTKGLHILSQPFIQRIAIANPKTAPYGKAAFEALEKTKLLKPLTPKFIYGQSISQTVAYTLTACDIGLVATSSLYSPKMKHLKKNQHWTKVDTSLYTSINQGIVILKKAQNNLEVKAFYDFMLSPLAQTILHDFGYTTP
jgi:molybdate transport system substrate-binding protein